ncbi:MAG: AAA family ATPase [Halobacteria archaeon]|nr:AAA family ATPase [Halobacteria archaeon]
MYEAFYNLTEKPFTLLPDPGFLYLSDKHQMALTLLEYGLHEHGGFTVISGEIGAGKTTLIRHLLNNMEQEYTVGLITNTHRSFGELLQWVLHAFGLEHKDMSRVEMHQRFIDFIIDEYAQNRRTVLIVDEAQNMDAGTLEELRMLSNINADKDQALQVILVGQRELRETLKGPDLVQFAQRITVDYHLEPLSADQTAAYIRHRMRVAGGNPATFTVSACKAVHRYSNGVPRLINLLCDTALVYGYAEQTRQIEARLVTDVAREKQQGGIFPIFAVASRDTADENAAAKPSADTHKDTVDDNAATEPPADMHEDTVGTTAPASRRPGPVSMELAASTEAQATTDKPAAEAGAGPARAAGTDPASQQETAELFESLPAGQTDPEDDEYRWLHGHKQRPRIAVFSAEEDLRRYLSRLLEAYGYRVVASLPIDAASLEDLEGSCLADIDLLLVDRDTSHPLPADAAGIISTWDKPVLYNDSTITARNLRQGNPDFGLELSEQIRSLLASSDADIAAI